LKGRRIGCQKVWGKKCEACVLGVMFFEISPTSSRPGQQTEADLTVAKGATTAFLASVCQSL
jgi:hypothetical protein